MFYDYDISRSYIIDSQNILGGWSGSYIGTSNNKKREKSIQLYVGDCDHSGKVQGIAQIEEGAFCGAQRPQMRFRAAALRSKTATRLMQVISC